MVKVYKALYFSQRFYQVALGIVFIFCLGYAWPFVFLVAKFLVGMLILTILADFIFLFAMGKGLFAQRHCVERFSNGDLNEVEITIENNYNFFVFIEVIDEVPVQFQRRDLSFYIQLKARNTGSLKYSLRPVERGEYYFGGLNLLTKSPIGLLIRRFVFDQDKLVKVYPSYVNLRKYELLAATNRLDQLGIKKIRKIGHAMEFEHIKEYVKGDDYRTINWKASARKNALMVNLYQDEKSQPVYSLIDKGRVMKMPFEGLSLLDYAINSTLIISNVAIKREDKAGVITFEKKIDTFVPADRKSGHMKVIQGALYNQETNYAETDYSELFLFVRRNVNQRSLLIIYTNFESRHGLERQLVYLRKLAERHLVLLVFFENSELDEIIHNKAIGVENIYNKAIAEQMFYEKHEIVKILNRHGVFTVLTKPKDLSVNLINKYLEMKSRHLI